MIHTQKKIDKKTIEYICLVIKNLKQITKQREMIAIIMLNKPEIFDDIVDCLGSDFYKIVPRV